MDLIREVKRTRSRINNSLLSPIINRYLVFGFHFALSNVQIVLYPSLLLPLSILSCIFVICVSLFERTQYIYMRRRRRGRKGSCVYLPPLPLFPAAIWRIQGFLLACLPFSLKPPCCVINGNLLWFHFTCLESVPCPDLGPAALQY
jgi:hypothetical protein